MLLSIVNHSNAATLDGATESQGYSFIPVTGKPWERLGTWDEDFGRGFPKAWRVSLKAVHVAAKVQTAALPALYPGQWGWPRRPAQVVALSFEELQLG